MSDCLNTQHLTAVILIALAPIAVCIMIEGLSASNSMTADYYEGYLNAGILNVAVLGGICHNGGDLDAANSDAVYLKDGSLNEAIPVAEILSTEGPVNYNVLGLLLF